MNPMLISIGGVAFLLAGLLYYAVFIEPLLIISRKYNLSLARPDIPSQGVQILHLSDFHFSGHFLDYIKIWLILKKIKTVPDLLICTGDFTDRAEGRVACQFLLNQLNSRFGRFAVLGNHDVMKYDFKRAYREVLSGKKGGEIHSDHLEETLQTLQRSHMIVLRNQTVPVNVSGCSIQILGVDEDISGLNQFEKMIDTIDSRALKVVIVHAPDQRDRYLAAGADLVLAGHTHGGQVCLPGIGPLILVSALPKKEIYGFHQFGKSFVHINRGVGCSRIAPFRFFCPPEIVWLSLFSNIGSKS